MPSYTYGQIQSRVADELNRSDLTSQIQLAIVSAVEAYERKRFWFNEATATATTTASTNYVSTPSDFVKEYFFQITVGSSKYTLSPMNYSDFLVATATSTTSGQPTQYSYYQDVFYLFPTPGSAYTLTLNYIKRLTTLAASGDNNGWTNYAEELLRQRAKADIRCNILKDRAALSEASFFAAKGEPYLSALEKQAFVRLQGENDDKVTVGKVKAYYL
jgi:hypothetical protein